MNSMSPLRSLSQFRLFQRNVWPASSGQIVCWWELRRIPFNLCVGGAGIITAAMCLVSGIIAERFIGEPIGIPDPPIVAVLVAILYGILANVCYTGGWIAEIVAVRVWGDKAKGIAEISFTLGLIFSVLLTLVPGFLIALLVAFKLMWK